MKKSLQLLSVFLFTFLLNLKGLACDPPTNLMSHVEQDIPGFDYTFKVSLSWDVVEGVDFYSIYFYSDYYPDGMWLGDTQEPNYVSGANTESVFYFAVSSHCSDGSVSNQSERCAVVIQNEDNPCKIPLNFQGVVVEDEPNSEYLYQITLSWDAVEGAESYDLYVNGDMFANTTETSYITGTDNPQELRFSVATICEDGSTSLVSPYITLNIDPCMPPINLYAAVEQDIPDFEHKYKVTLTWDAYEDASSYTIYENGEWKGYATENIFEIGYDIPTVASFNVTSLCDNVESVQSETYVVVIQDDYVDEYAADNFEIYPNPACDNITINTDVNITEISIFNIVGVCVYNESNLYDDNIDVSGLNDGVYFVKINTDKCEVVKRFVKQ